MINAGQIREIVRQYEKHGWILRRVLLSPVTLGSLGDAPASLFGDAPVATADVDAAWFSRPSKGDGEAWELRRLSGSPFALVEIFDADDDEAVRDQTRQEMEKTVSGKR